MVQTPAGTARKMESWQGTQVTSCGPTNGRQDQPAEMVSMPNLGRRETVVSSKALPGAIQTCDLIPSRAKISVARRSFSSWTDGGREANSLFFLRVTNPPSGAT